MITHPSAQEILQAVSQWIEDLRPRLEGRDAFLARVSMHALATVRRELDQAAPSQAAATARLIEFLGHDKGNEEDEGYDALVRELCERLRTGELDAGTPGLLTLLRADTLARLHIDQPDYKSSA